MSFLPEGYELPKSNSGNGHYLKLQQGDNKIRILSNPIVGYVYWSKEDKPIRLGNAPDFTPFDLRTTLTKWGKPESVKHFWALHVYDFVANRVAILEITQSVIQEGIIKLLQDDDWGDPRNYNIKISKTGQGTDTKYAVIPTLPSPMSPDVSAAIASTPVNLNALFCGSDPFSNDWENDARNKLYERINEGHDYCKRYQVNPPAPACKFEEMTIDQLIGYCESLLRAISLTQSF